MKIPDQIDRYQIIEILGYGGFAVVYLANDPRLNRQVAIKLLTKTSIDTSASTARTTHERFEAEVEILVALEFDGVVRIYDYGEFERQPYLVMQYMPGGTLAEKIANNPLSLTETAVILNRLCTP